MVRQTDDDWKWESCHQCTCRNYSSFFRDWDWWQKNKKRKCQWPTANGQRPTAQRTKQHNFRNLQSTATANAATPQNVQRCKVTNKLTLVAIIASRRSESVSQSVSQPVSPRPLHAPSLHCRIAVTAISQQTLTNELNWNYNSPSHTHWLIDWLIDFHSFIHSFIVSSVYQVYIYIDIDIDIICILHSTLAYEYCLLCIYIYIYIYIYTIQRFKWKSTSVQTYQ